MMMLRSVLLLALLSCPGSQAAKERGLLYRLLPDFVPSLFARIEEGIRDVVDTLTSVLGGGHPHRRRNEFLHDGELLVGQRPPSEEDANSLPLVRCVVHACFFRICR